MTRLEKILSPAAAALALCLGLELPRAIARDWPGFPNALIFDTWTGRTNPNIVAIGNAANSTALVWWGDTAQTAGPYIRSYVTANPNLDIGSTTASAVLRLLFGPSQTILAQIGGAGTGTVSLCPAGSCNAALGGGATITAWPVAVSWGNSSNNCAASGTCDFGKWQSPNVSGSLTVETCIAAAVTAGTNASTATLELFDITAAGIITGASCTMAGTASNGTTCTFAVGAVPANHQIAYRVVNQAGGTAVAADMACSLHY